MKIFSVQKITDPELARLGDMNMSDPEVSLLCFVTNLKVLLGLMPRCKYVYGDYDNARYRMINRMVDYVKGFKRTLNYAKGISHSRLKTRAFLSKANTTSYRICKLSIEEIFNYSIDLLEKLCELKGKSIKELCEYVESYARDLSNKTNPPLRCGSLE